MPRQNPNLLSSAADLRGAAAMIRAAVGSGTFEDLKAALTAAAGAFDQAEGAFGSIEQRLRDLGEANVNDPRRPAGVLVSGDRIRGGVQVQGGLRSVMGQGMDLTFASQVSHVTSYDHGADGYLELDLDGLGVTVNAHGGTITLTGTISLSAPLTVPMGGTGTATGSITGTTALTFTAGGTAQNVSLISSTTGKVILKPGTNSTTAIQIQNAAGTALLNVDSTNGRVGIGTVAPAGTLHVKTGGNTDVDFEAGAALRLRLTSVGTTQFHIAQDFYVANGFSIHDATNNADPITCLAGPKVGINKTAPNSVFAVVGLPTYANNAAAVGGGLTAGDAYRTNADPDTVCVVH